jgi:hypothetical protein
LLEAADRLPFIEAGMHGTKASSFNALFAAPSSNRRAGGVYILNHQER